MNSSSVSSLECTAVSIRPSPVPTPPEPPKARVSVVDASSGPKPARGATPMSDKTMQEATPQAGLTEQESSPPQQEAGQEARLSEVRPVATMSPGSEADEKDKMDAFRDAVSPLLVEENLESALRETPRSTRRSQ